MAGKDLVVDLTVKHPLHHTWVLWFYECDRNHHWLSNQKMVTSFKYVEEFWSIYNNIKLATDLPLGCDYAIFKSGIMPMWEDKANEAGGRWVAVFEKKTRDKELDRFWLDLLLLLIGEGFNKNSKQICGAVLNIRRNVDKICLWIKDARNKDAVHEIGRIVKDCMATATNVQIYFESHEESMSGLRPV